MRRLVRLLCGSGPRGGAGLAAAALLSLVTPLAAQDRPTVGLVLSGGSARGLAHIGVIQVLEEAGVNVDLVTGTSMGSVVGGLYAAGYEPDEMFQVASSADWDRLLSDQKERRNLPLERRTRYGRYLLALPVRDGKPTLPGGFIAGQNITQFLEGITWRVHPVEYFRDLPLPYAAVATDIETGDAVRLDRGFLPVSIRASMAIPGVFAPVEIDGRLLVDGGISRNLPAEDALALGADFLICSDVSKPLLPADSLTTLFGILDQTIAFRGNESTLAQRELCDVLILPDLEGLSSTDFALAAPWMARGDSAARAVLPELQAAGLTGPSVRPPLADAQNGDPWADSVTVVDVILVSDSIRVSRDYVLDRMKIDPPGRFTVGDLDAAVSRLYDTGRFRSVSYRLLALPGQPASTNAPVRLMEISLERSVDQGHLGVSYRYDSRYKASILGTLELRDLLGHGSFTDLDIRAGTQTYLGARYTNRLGRGFEIVPAVGLEYRRMPFDIYEGSRRIGTPRASVVSLPLFFGTGLGQGGLIGVRIKPEYGDQQEFEGVAGDSAFQGGTGTYYTISAMFALDTRDRALFPSRGLRVMLKSEWADPAIGSGAHFSSNVLDVSGAWPVGRNVSLLGRVIAGNAAGDDLPDYYLFYLGGSQPYYLFPDRQFEFAGLRTAQRFGRAVQTVVAGVQVEVRPDVFARLRWNAGSTLPEWTGLDLDDWTTGGDLTGALRTRFGTFSLTLATERFTDFLVSIDAGYAF